MFFDVWNAVPINFFALTMVDVALEGKVRNFHVIAHPPPTPLSSFRGTLLISLSPCKFLMMYDKCWAVIPNILWSLIWNLVFNVFLHNYSWKMCYFRIILGNFFFFISLFDFGIWVYFYCIFRRWMNFLLGEKSKRFVFLHCLYDRDLRCGHECGMGDGILLNGSDNWLMFISLCNLLSLEKKNTA